MKNMITFAKISSKTIRAPYTIEIDGFKVAGTATYNKENRLTDAYGTITTSDGKSIGSFNIHGVEGEKRININDCPSDMMNEAAEVTQKVLAALSSTYPQE